MMMYN